MGLVNRIIAVVVVLALGVSCLFMAKASSLLPHHGGPAAWHLGGAAFGGRALLAHAVASLAEPGGERATATMADPRLWFHMPQEGRPRACLDRTYDIGSMPSVSVIIPYLHEDLLLMQKTIGSLIANTPEALLDEILFVDDANDANHSYAGILQSLHPKVKVHRNEKRQGLIHAKVTGAANTRSRVIVFMEPHCIANRQWLEPLLAHLMGSPRSVVVPVIDIIPEDATDAYSYASPMYGSFGWNLEFTWGGTAARRNSSYRLPDPFPMPSLSGGILAMWRDWWEASGTYDSQMAEWGSEHIEMSLRVWRCGGTVEAVPCSRIGHMFRRARPYEFHGEAANRNKKRLVKVWLPEYHSRVLQVQPQLRDLSEAGDVKEREELRDRLGCKSMDWYINNVYPELATAK